MQPATMFSLLVIGTLAYVVYRCTKKLVEDVPDTIARRLLPQSRRAVCLERFALDELDAKHACMARLEQLEVNGWRTLSVKLLNSLASSFRRENLW
ncbi:hypothetical protein DBIPINDM_007524 (plasmid) [Mesorhizobium sp. AR02]|uniref:hypothetical protein n=1 Tax=Mesorhizobium sp. AR02 TaxID=2865837 RepID=UPI00215F8C0B|nr:hypothetical protein [Mesorhizobium sp. AR02]UVK50217.1 hypothetical protein DBIPINDM_007524 [Mesorhizobium sp. AR02]